MFKLFIIIFNGWNTKISARQTLNIKHYTLNIIHKVSSIGLRCRIS
jgi:hypothetical protein